MWGESAGWSGGGTASFKIYWDAGVPGPFVPVLLATTGERTYLTDRLADGTYRFRVNPVDAAGNEFTSAKIVSVTINAPPQPATGFEVTSYTVGTMTFAASWTPSPSADVTEYRIYSDGGTGEVDYETPVATIVAPASSGTWVEVGTAGPWIHAIRAYDGVTEENNVDQRFEYELGGAPLDVLPPPPSIPIGLRAAAIPAGQVALSCAYLASIEEAVGTLVNFYGDGGTGVVDFVTPVASAAIPAHALGARREFTVSAATAALTDGVLYRFAAKAETAAGRESEASEEVTARADATPPPELATLTGVAVL